MARNIDKEEETRVLGKVLVFCNGRGVEGQLAKKGRCVSVKSAPKELVTDLLNCFNRVENTISINIYDDDLEIWYKPADPGRIEKMRRLFRDTEKENGVDLSTEPFEWAYFFLSKDPFLKTAAKNLNSFSLGLMSAGYSCSPIAVSGDCESLYLVAKKRERHTPATLATRSAEFAHVAAKEGIEYDGVYVSEPLAACRFEENRHSVANS